MIYIIDNAKLKVVKAVKVYDRARYWGEILCKGDFRIGLDGAKIFSAYTADELVQIVKNTTGESVPVKDRENYAAMIQHAHRAAKTVEQDDTDVAALRKKLGRSLEPITDEATPAELARAGRVTGAVEPSEGTTSSRAPVVSGPRVKPAKTPSQLHDRPKGGKTGKVWDIADEIKAKMPNADKKTLRDAVLKKCNEEGCNPAMAATQYSRWRNVQEAKA